MVICVHHDAPDQQTSLPPDVALAYASILTKAPPPSFEQRWTAWGSAFGGANRTNGDPVVGSNTTTASTYGFAGGMDYHFTPYTVAGFALAGAGTNWGLANALGTGRSDTLQAGAYGISWFGPAYVAGALSFSNHWFTTVRSSARPCVLVPLCFSARITSQPAARSATVNAGAKMHQPGRSKNTSAMLRSLAPSRAS
jgi:hypothetical protein